jgi:hypothetical protein
MLDFLILWTLRRRSLKERFPEVKSMLLAWLPEAEATTSGNIFRRQGLYLYSEGVLSNRNHVQWCHVRVVTKAAVSRPLHCSGSILCIGHPAILPSWIPFRWKVLYTFLTADLSTWELFYGRRMRFLSAAFLLIRPRIP